MKKIITLLVFSFLVVSCGSKAEIDSAKQELLGDNVSQETPISQDAAQREQQENTSLDSQDDSLVQIISLDANSPLSFDEISEDSLSSWEVVISWQAWPDVDKIEVFFTNPNSTYADDRYTLQTYVKWEWDFRYIASSKNKVLDYGMNEYIFRAYSGELQSETKIILTVQVQDTNQQKWEESQLIGTEDNSILIDFPISTKYGEPLMLWEDSFTYTQIKWLEVQKQILPELDCDGVTEYLWESINTWYYWNTCRDIVKDKWIKFNVIRLDGDNYVYERHYVDFTKWLYGVYELETGEWVDKDNIQEKNNELKEQDFPTLEIVDDLMRDILNA